VAKRFTSLIMLLVFLAYMPVSAQNQTVIWYLPHPDDETIGMADAIHQSVLADHRNYFIYFTKGENSLTRYNIQNAHGERYELSKEGFGEARVRETLAALEVLGVESHQVLFLDYPDGAVPLSAAKETMRFFASLYPGSIHRTVSQHDPHEDHQTLARALAEVSASDDTVYADFFHVYIYRNEKLLAEMEKRKVLSPDIKGKALAEFNRFDPENGRFAIAMISTPDLIEAALASEYEFVDPVDGRTSTARKCPGIGLTMSNLDLGLNVSISERVSVIGLYDYKTGGGMGGMNVKLMDNIPLLQVNLGVGYHFSYQSPYLTTGLNMGPYFVKLRHVPGQETRLGVGIFTTNR